MPALIEPEVPSGRARKFAFASFCSFFHRNQTAGVVRLGGDDRDLKPCSLVFKD